MRNSPFLHHQIITLVIDGGARRKTISVFFFFQMNSDEKNTEERSKGTLARFGNKKVIKYSDEYHHQRLKNNQSVKNSRIKAKQRQKETETKMNRLADENRQLNERFESLMKELQVLKSLYSDLGQSLPADAVKSLEQINLV